MWRSSLADQDGIYNPTDTNDRLLLGLKGTMSEFEAFTMRNRLQQGRLHKAEKGEIYIAVPCGYLKLPSGQVVVEPDEQARSIVQLVFDKFEELGTACAVTRYLLLHHLRIGIRLRFGARRGELEWRRPSLATVMNILHHPMYAGAYVFGRRTRHRKCLPMEQWQVLKRDHLPAYITWERYVANQQRLRANVNQPSSPGAPRTGLALLSGLLICGKCGRRMRTAYRHAAQPHYQCEPPLLRGAADRCCSMNAHALDELVAQQVLRALEPAALELSLQAEQDIDQERQRLHQQWQKQRERLRYEAERAERQYRAVEPENRLVARTLEQSWEAALRKQRDLEDEYERFLHNQPAQLSEAERRRIRELADDLPALWHAPATSAVQRKEIVRCLVEKVVVQIRKDSEYVDATIHWQGGYTSQYEVARPVRTYAGMRDFPQLCKRLLEMRTEGLNAAQMADRLNQEGFSPPKRSGRFSEELVRQLLCRQGISNERTCLPRLAPHEWWLRDLARELKMPAGKLRGWIERGWLHGRQTPAQHLWIVWADRDELRRLRKLVARSHRGVTFQPRELTTPRKRT